MAKKKKEIVELRFYEIPQGEAALTLLGEPWVRVYGHDEDVFRLHFHNLMEIGICRYGNGDMYYDEEKIPYSDGAISVVPENCPHVTISEGNSKNFWEYIFFNPRQIVAELFPDNHMYQSEIMDEINKKSFLVNIKDNPSLGRVVNIILDEARDRKEFSSQIIHQYVKALVLELIRNNEKIPYYEEAGNPLGNSIKIAPILEYINENYMKPLKASDLAEVGSMSETHFRRVFEAHVNMSPMDYVNLIRIQKACEMMKKGDESMDMVAQNCGFATTSTFNRNFKKFLDTSPYQWKINPANYERKLLNYHISALKGW